MSRVAAANRSALGPSNYWLRSDAIANAAWSKVRCSVADATADVTAPDGTSSATKWTEDASAGTTHFFQAAASPVTVRDGQALTCSFWLRGGGTLPNTRRVYIHWNDATGLAYADFNPRTGLVDQNGTAARVRNEMVASQGGWYRCASTLLIVPAGQEANAAIVFFELDNGANGAAIANVYDGDGSSGVYIAGLTLAFAPTPTDYVRTTAAAVVASTRGLVR